MRIPPVFKVPEHPAFSTLIVPGDHPNSVDNSDATLGILRHAKNDYFRVAQLGMILHGEDIEIANIQGSGPRQKFAAYGLDTQAVFDSFERFTGLKPLNTLLAVSILFSKSRHEFRRIFCDTHRKGGEFNYATILQALKFRPNRNSPNLLELDLSINEDRVLERVTGKSNKKRDIFEVIHEAYRGRLESLFNHTLKSDPTQPQKTPRQITDTAI